MPSEGYVWVGWEGAERATGIEPAFSAWEADVLPLYDARATSWLADHASPYPARRGIAPAGLHVAPYGEDDLDFPTQRGSATA